MRPLEKSLRNNLERTVKEARDITETAARASLEQLGVGEPAAYPHLSDEERNLRRRLRAHGRQLGNGRDAKGRQEIARLIEEVAYEHWHRMLFARFLAENNLLMYPDPDDPVAVTLEECEDLAADEGTANGWELAARFAARMLPQIFRVDSPVFQLALPPEHQQKLERLIANLSQEVFTASDSLGWVYQFWQAKKKDEVNASEVKIGARELPAVTQLFTEPYMVSFLLDNSLGAWWVKKLTVGSRQSAEKAREILRTAENEQELRDFFSIPGVPLSYLRFVQTENSSVLNGSHWMPATGWFDGWPEHLGELKTLDPCCGSGHFLVAAFLMLVPMRMGLEELSAREAVDRVLSENIHGLELDQRCVELAAFSLALSAWKYPGAGGYRLLSELNVACSGLAISAKKDEWLALAGENTNLRQALEELYKQFKDAPVLGSLINPEASLGKGSLFELKWEDVGPLLTKALSAERDDEKSEMGIVARGLANAAELIVSKYKLIITNVPYKTKGDLAEPIQCYLEKTHTKAKSALETAFLDRIINWLSNDGVANIVLPQNMLFLKSYSAFRKTLLEHKRWLNLAWLGDKAFQTPVDASPILLSIGNLDSKSRFPAIDVSKGENVATKANLLKSEAVKFLLQIELLRNPDYRITFHEVEHENLLTKVAECYQGILTGDKDRFFKGFWEICTPSIDWDYSQTTNNTEEVFGGLSEVVLWEGGAGDLHAFAKENRHKLHDMHESGNRAWGRAGVALNQQGNLKATHYFGSKFDGSLSVLFPKSGDIAAAIWSYCSSLYFSENVRKIDKKRNVTNATFLKVRFDFAHWDKVAQGKYPNGIPKPYSDDPTQWIFHGHPCGSVIWDEEKKWTAIGHLRTNATVLQVAVARLLGSRWPAETDLEIDLSDEARAWVKKSEELLPFADGDGIVCIPPIGGEMKAEDRLENLLVAAYGSEWSSSKKSELLFQADHAGKTLETWLRDKFFTQHCKLFHHRPFVWHIWDGLRDGFAALVNYHKLDAKLLETLIYTYLGDWIGRQKQDIAGGVDGAQEKLAAAESLKKKLELTLEGEAPYDIFVRWKPIEKQPIGWNPDLNDGVRLNIRAFMTVPDVGKKGAGVLRDKPNIKWGKDRGKDVASAPWYHLFKGDRINDYHLTLEEKRQARAEASARNGDDT